MINRRSFVGRLFASLGALVGIGSTAKAKPEDFTEINKVLGQIIASPKRARVTMLAPKVDRLKLLTPSEAVPFCICDKANYVFDKEGNCNVDWKGSVIVGNVPSSQVYGEGPSAKLLAPYTLELRDTLYRVYPNNYSVHQKGSKCAIYYDVAYQATLRKL